MKRVVTVSAVGSTISDCALVLNYPKRNSWKYWFAWMDEGLWTARRSVNAPAGSADCSLYLIVTIQQPKMRFNPFRESLKSS